ncbi:hypothetical protein D9757_000561 [Collybiopsis confluens]|uniref:Uncharacterized protein n=1 Tax=Collybiopsis confluens TaxID=2823264 RepID=A0A8H5MGQ4_9AGAR|nr:hypothetical protein D9757_000561 [Collybiopsis confluens]
MSTPDAEGGLKPMLMRSTTPAPNDKVLKYLDGMAQAEAADDLEPTDFHDEMQSNRSGVSRQSRPTASRRSQNGALSPRSQNGQILQDLAGSAVSYDRLNSDPRVEDDDDMSSDVQQRSEGGTALPVAEPGPHDAPGPHYISYTSSFGNMGPLPPDDFPPRDPYNTWNQSAWTTEATRLTPLNTTGNSLGAGAGAGGGFGVADGSPRGSIAIGVESPSAKSRPRSQVQSRASEKSPSEHYSHAAPTSPRAASKAPTTRTVDRPLSPPQSIKSQGTNRTRPTERGTPYPSLPESRFGGEESMYDGPPSPTRSRAKPLSKAPSVSPSDSLSQIYIKRAPRIPPSREATYVNHAEGGINGAEFSPRSSARQIPVNGNGRAPMSPTSLSHQSRPFSPYRHAPTQEDLLAAAVRGRAIIIPEEEEPAKATSVAHSKVSRNSRLPSSVPSAAPSRQSRQTASSTDRKTPSKQPSITPSQQSRKSRQKDTNATPTPSRPHTPDMDEMNQEEARIVERALASAARTPRTSLYSPSAIDAEVQQSSFHDNELCILLHQLKAPQTHDLVRKVVLKAVKQRMKKLSMNYDNESIKQYQKTYHNHDPMEQLPIDESDEPPKWASDLKREILLTQQRIESLGPKIENLRPPPPPPQSYDDGGNFYDDDQYTNTPVTQTVGIHTQATGTMAESMYQPETEMSMEDVHPRGHLENDGEFDDDGDMTEPSTQRGFPAPTTDQTRTPPNYALSDGRDDSPGQQYLEEELYKLRQRPSAAGAEETTWDVRRSDIPDDYEDGDDEDAPAVAPTIPGSEAGDFGRHSVRSSSPPLPPIPRDDVSQRSIVPQNAWAGGNYNDHQQDLPPWQKIHQRLLSWAIIWPLSELDEALNSTTRGHQVNEVAMSIWSTQTYKRYVRSRMTDSPAGVVDRLFVPPNMADAISNAVFNGRHGDACGMLRDLWSPFGLQGMPRLLVVLAKHRSDENHWVVHRFSLPDGSLTTYDSYPERTLPDGRPLGWWFAIRVAWPNAIYPSPDNLMQKMVRLHRPMQLPIDNSVAAGGIWRNILMGSRAERSLDLERLRDLINTEVRNLRQRKLLGKLSINAPRPQWEDMS